MVRKCGALLRSTSRSFSPLATRNSESSVPILQFASPRERTTGATGPIFPSWINRASYDLCPRCIAGARQYFSVGVGFSYVGYGEVVETTEDHKERPGLRHHHLRDLYAASWVF